MYEQLNSNKAKRVLAVLEAGSSNSNLLGTFKAQASDFNLIKFHSFSIFINIFLIFDIINIFKDCIMHYLCILIHFGMFFTQAMVHSG